MEKILNLRNVAKMTVACLAVTAMSISCKKDKDNEVTLQSIEVTAQPTKKTYEVNDLFETAGMVVTATYSDESTSPVTVKADMLTYDFSTVGAKTVTIIYQGKTTTVTGITVIETADPVLVTGITIAPAGEVSVIVDCTIPLTATVTPANATNKNITWSSLHPTIATVHASTGVVTGVGEGTATICATAADGSNVSNTKTVTVTAVPPNTIIITTEAQLRELAKKVNGTGGFEPNSFEGQTFMLANNITLTGGNWEPIGRSAAVSDAGPWDKFPFEGTFDGNGKTVSNVIIKGNIYFSGFFGWVGENGHVKNLGVHIAEYDVSKSWGNANAGGIAGQNEGIIEKCFAIGDIKAGTAWIAYVFVGGLVGCNYGGIISECYATGNVHAFSPASLVYVGGLVGALQSRLDNVASVVNSYATGNVSVGNNSGLYMGGLVGDNGYTTSSNTIVENCYSTGIVSGTGGNVGGLVGRNPGTVTASYYDSETSGQSDTGKGEPKTTAAMKNRTTFEDWDFVDIWGINASANSGYPYLR